MLGELSALLAAFSYASGANVTSAISKLCSPIQLNYLRGLISISFLFLCLLIFSDSIFPEDAYRNY